jgi:EmrB/QacA subfamily drug resistance transporter
LTVGAGAVAGQRGLEFTTTTTDSSSRQQASAEGDAKWWTLAAVCIGTFMLLLDITIVNVALPDIQGELKASFSDLQWAVDAYALTLASLLLTAGSIADLFGRRLLYIIGVVLFTGASVLCGAATGPLMLEVSRGLQGVGGAVMFAVSLALLANAFRGKDRGVAFGIWGMATGTAVGIGPVLGGALVALSWRWIFFVNVPVGIIALAITWWKVAESKQAGARRPDWAGFVVFTAALALLVYALIESGRTSFSDTTVIACFAAGGALIVVFLFVEIRGDHPMLDLSLFRLPTFSGGAIAAFAVSAGIFSMLLYLVLYLQNVLGFSALGAGTRLLLISGGIFVTSAITGRLTAYVPIRLLVGPGLMLIGIGLLLMRGIDATSSWTHLIPGFIVSGIGIGMMNPPLAATAVGVVRPERAGMASGISSTFRQVGIATGIALLGTLLASKLRDDIGSGLAGTPLAGRSASITDAVKAGDFKGIARNLPPDQATLVDHVGRVAFADSLNYILLVAAIMTLVCGVLALGLIRGKDFIQHDAPTEPGL